MRIMFMGTPDFAAIALKGLCENGNTPVCCVTKVDKPAKRGYKLTASPVKIFALENNIPVEQPVKLSVAEFEETLKKYDPELIIVVAYGVILPKYVLDYPKYGCINVHGSLLPEYRGAAPMQRAIIDGCDKTGVTIMKMAEGLDTGDMILKLETPISESDNLETIHDRLAELGVKGLLEVIPALQNGTAVFEPQDDSRSSYAAKITKEDGVLDFSRPARELSCLVRGLSPFPYAYCKNGDTVVKITDARFSEKRPEGAKCGEVVSVSGGEIVVACGEGTLRILGVFPESKKRMSASDYVNGGKIHVGDLLG